MKIGIQTWGTEGDVRPFLALAGGLSAAGHQVTLAATEITGKSYERFSGPLGVEIRHVGRNAEMPPPLREVGGRIFRARDPLLQVRLILNHFFDPFVPEMLAAARALCRENDAVIGHFLLHPLRLAAIQSRRPRASLFTAPVIPTRHHMAGGFPSLGETGNRLLWHVAGWVMDRLLLPPANRLLKQQRQPRARHIIPEIWTSPFLNLVAVSPTLYPSPGDWPEHTALCGFLNLPHRREPWTPSPALRQFLAAGPEPVCITFGSMMEGEPDPGALADLLIQAVRRAGCRAIIQIDPARLAGRRPEPDLHFLAYADHHRLFPRCAAIVHHGGAGTTQSAARSGRPSVIVPHATDQTFWALTLHRLGITSPPIHRASLTARRLASALETACRSTAIRNAAEHAGRRMRREDGVATAVRLVESRLRPVPAGVQGPEDKPPARGDAP